MPNKIRESICSKFVNVSSPEVKGPSRRRRKLISRRKLAFHFLGARFILENLKTCHICEIPRGGKSCVGVGVPLRASTTAVARGPFLLIYNRKLEKKCGEREKGQIFICVDDVFLEVHMLLTAEAVQVLEWNSCYVD